MQRFDINLVAHADDDTLFQQPDIINSLIAGVGQTTVYLTCGNDVRWNDLVYLRRREQGAMDAYAEMGLIRSSKMGTNPGALHWNVRQTNEYRPLSATVADCVEYPNVHLIFIRLSACRYTGDRWTQDFEMRTVPPVNDLEDLWVGNCSSLTAVDDSDIFDPSAVPPHSNWVQTAYPPWLQREYSTQRNPAIYFSISYSTLKAQKHAFLA